MAEHVFQRSRIVLVYFIFASLLVVGIALLVIGQGISAIGTTPSDASHEMAPEQHMHNDFSSNAVRLIVTTDELKAAISTSRCILFVNCDWNEFTVAFRQPFSDFAVWSSEITDYRTIAVKLNGDSQGELWTAIQELWQMNGISPGGLKNFGGTGRVVWFKDGHVVDYAWSYDVQGVDKLKSRTKDAFQ